MRVSEIVELARALNRAKPENYAGWTSAASAEIAWQNAVGEVAKLIPEEMRARFVKACEDGAMMRLVSKRSSS